MNGERSNNQFCERMCQVASTRYKRASAGRRRCSGRTLILVKLERCINSLTGTDGFPVLCHQFAPSCLPRLATCISRCKTCWLTMKPMTPALLRWVANGAQGPNIRKMVFPLKTGRWLFIVWWRTTNHFVKLQMSMMSHMKRSVASSYILRSRVDSKKRNDHKPVKDPPSSRLSSLCSQRGAIGS
jgi:hypothetical protein